MRPDSQEAYLSYHLRDFIFLVNDEKNPWSICQPCDTVINNVSWFAESLTYICHNVTQFCHLFTFPYYTLFKYGMRVTPWYSNNHSFYFSDFKNKNSTQSDSAQSLKSPNTACYLSDSLKWSLWNRKFKAATTRGEVTLQKIRLAWVLNFKQRIIKLL